MQHFTKNSAKNSRICILKDLRSSNLLAHGTDVLHNNGNL